MVANYWKRIDTMTNSLDRFLALMDLEQLEENLFRGDIFELEIRHVFGGQVIGQSLIAAQRTVTENKACHSLHAYFLRAGDPDIPIVFQVDRALDGRSFSSRRVVAIQHGDPIFIMSASFHIEEEGSFSHQIEMPDVKPPEESMSGDQLAHLIEESGFSMKAAHMGLSISERSPMEMRFANPPNIASDAPIESNSHIWMRARQPLETSQAVQQAILGFASDISLIGTSAKPHIKTWIGKGLQLVSLDHAMWFHAPVNINDWLLYTMDSPFSARSRGLAHGKIFSKTGQLIASVAQEGLMRVARKKKGTPQ